MPGIVTPEYVNAVGESPVSSVDRYFYVVNLQDDMIMEWDGYRTEELDGKIHWMILITCPKCNNELRLETAKKQILIDDKGLHIAETIRCTHPAEFGGMCTWHVGIEPPRKSSDREARIRGQKIKVDAIARHC